VRYQHIIEQVYFQPWLITEAGHAAIAHLLESHLADSAQRQGTDFCGAALELEQMQIIDGIAHIPIGGVIGKKLTGFEKGAGAVDVNDVSAELHTAELDSTVTRILLHIDSPGGMVTGTPELAAQIGRSSKPIYAFTDGSMASGAYWLGAAADAVFATATGNIGSIGVYLPVVDSTKQMDMRGLKIDLIKAGTLKGAGFPGTKLSEDQRAHLQQRVNDIHGMFTTHVSAHRGTVADATMQGQTFMAREALARNLIDGIVSSKADLLARLLAR
jgi:signal peptide peptidase SppA